MEIKRLKLSGFKSFVEPAELRIERGLTGIVGPNGCGKSNLLEAIRWVMGEGSAKSLRGGAMDDVIFAGTATRPSRDFAEVSLHAITLDADEIDVVRRIERGAGSAYRVNGRDVRAKDVALLFADAATGAHSPALVSQGRISAVIAAKPAERRMMLEEAAGISGLHVRRKDAEQKLRATETNLGRLDEVIGDMEVRIGQLRRQARMAEKYRTLSEAIKTAEGRLIYSRWRDAASAAKLAKAEAETAQAAVDVATQAQTGAAAWQTKAVTALGALRGAAQAARDAAAAAGHKLATLGAERAALDLRIADLEAQQKRLASDREREGELARDAAEALARLASEAKSLELRIASEQARLPGFVGQIASAESAVRDAEVELAHALSTQAREQAETRVADAALAAAAAKHERSSRDLARLTVECDALGSDTDLCKARDQALAARQTAEAEGVAARAAIETAEAERQAGALARDTAQSACAAAQAALAALEGEALALVKALESKSGKARALDSVRVAPGYERALAAALGDDLESDIGGGNGGDAHGWTGAEILVSDPELPAGSVSLNAHVEAPAELKRRLAQIVVVDADGGDILAVGQRLVTRAGLMRRWDGFVSSGDGAAAAERLERVNRLTALETAIAPARAAVETERAILLTAQSATDAARASGEAARTLLAHAEAATRAAQRDEDVAVTAIERLTSRRGEYHERLTRVAAEQHEAEADQATAHTARTSLPDGVETGQLVIRLQAASETARAHVAQVKADAASLERGIAVDRDRLGAARAEAKGWQSRSGEAARRLTEMEARAAAAKTEATSLEGAPAKLAANIAAREQESAALAIAATDAAAAERTGETELREHEAKLADIGEALATAREARAGAMARAENQELRRVEMGRVAGERFECPAPLLPERVGFDAETVRDASYESQQLEALTMERERLGPVNLIAETELVEIEATRATSITERDELAEAISRLRGSIGALNREGRTRLLAAFEAVNGHFERLFATLFNGGQAHLALIDSDDPLEAGLEIFAQPPGKKLAALTLLSGGEQALTAVALIFGLFLTNPAPICVLDEVDAPLDDANIERFCGLLDMMTRETKTRYLIVTHNAVTMSRMHRLFGVTMIEQGISRLVSVDLGGAEALLAAA